MCLYSVHGYQVDYGMGSLMAQRDIYIKIDRVRLTGRTIEIYVPPYVGHIYEDHRAVVDGPCFASDGRRSCPICDGGLCVCKICGLAEGELTTECPGVSSRKYGSAVYAGMMDFRDGRWVMIRKSLSSNDGEIK